MILEKQIKVAFITGRQSEIVNIRAKELHVTEVIQNCNNKLDALNSLIKKHHITYDDVAYIGDDLVDLDCLRVVRYSACPSNAVIQIKNVCNFICKHAGGEGAVREFIDYLLIILNGQQSTSHEKA